MRLTVLTLLCVPTATRAEGGSGAKPAEIVGVRVGLGDGYKVGLWTPVEVTLRGGRLASGRLSLTVSDGDGVPSRVSTALAAGQTTARSHVRFGRVQSELTVELYDGDQPIDRKVFQTAALPVAWKLIVSVGGDPLAMEGALDAAEAVSLYQQEGTVGTALVQLDDAGQLPQQWYGYEGVDVVVLSTSGHGVDSRRTLSETQAAALHEWVEMGGKLVFCVGSRAGSVLADESPLRRFAPGTLQVDPATGRATVSLKQTGSLEDYAHGRHPVPRPPDVSREVLAAHLVDVRGVIEKAADDLPLVVRTPCGFGRIVFFAADLDQEPLSKWEDRPLLIGRLLDLPSLRTEQADDRMEARKFGYDDMAGQLRSALDRFSGVRNVPFLGVVAVLMAVFVVLIGPVDYFLLRRFAPRMQWTWVTFPTIVVLSCIGAYALAHWCKRDEVRTNQVDLIDVDVTSGRVRGTTWVNVFSPETATYNLSLRPKLPDGTTPRDAKVVLSWLGLPGRGLGGMNPRTGDPVLWTEPYDFSTDLDSMQGVPIQVWSTKSFTARWTAEAGPGLEASLVRQGEVLSGTVTNTLGIPLADCKLVYGSGQDPRYAQVHFLGTVKPGASAGLEEYGKSVQLQTWLIGRHAVPSKNRSYRERSRRYPRESTDVDEILRVMMFFQVPRGREYTGLGNDYQGFVDLSERLTGDCALLIANGPTDPAGRRHGVELLHNNRPLTDRDDRHVTIYRFVLPVKIVEE